MAEQRGAGEEKKVLSFLAGKDFEWSGMKPDRERVDLPEDTPSQVINMRYDGSRLIGRGGQSLKVLHSKPITGMIDFFTEIEGGSGPSFPMPPMMILGLLGGIGSINDNSFFDHLSGNVQGMNSLSRDFSGNWIFGNNEVSDPASVRRVTGDLWASDYTSLFTIPNGPTFGGVFNRIDSIVLNDAIGLICANQFVGSHGTESSVIYKWDGTSFTLERYNFSPVWDSIAMSNGDFVICLEYDNTSSKILKRTPDGTWTSYDVPESDAIFGGSRFAFNYSLAGYSDLCEFDGSVYTVNNDLIIKFDGASVSALDYTTTGIDAREVSPVGTSLIFSCFSTTDALYYVWGKTTGGALNPSGLTDLKIGKFDGVSWDPSFKDILSQAELTVPTPSLTGAPSIIDGSVYIGYTTPTGSSSRTYATITAPVDSIDSLWRRGIWRRATDPGSFTAGPMGRALAI